MSSEWEKVTSTRNTLLEVDTNWAQSEGGPIEPFWYKTHFYKIYNVLSKISSHPETQGGTVVYKEPACKYSFLGRGACRVDHWQSMQ